MFFGGDEAVSSGLKVTHNKSLPGEKKYISTHETGSNIVNPIIKLAVRGFIVSLNQSFL